MMYHRRKSFGIVFGLGILLAGCSGGSESTTSKRATGTDHQASAGPSGGTAPAGGYEVVQVANAGKVIGKVSYGGTAPAPQKLDITKDQQVCGTKDHYKEDLVVSGDKGVANVVVSLEGIHQGKEMDDGAGNPRLDQETCTFVPHVQVVAAGSTVEVYNNDGILHNIHTFSEKNRPINRAQPKFLKKVEVEFTEPEVIKVTCDAHGWMSAWIVVADHPYYTVTDEKGNFQLDGVPPGTYSVKFWHEKLGESTGKITVGSGEAASLDHTYPAG